MNMLIEPHTSNLQRFLCCGRASHPCICAGAVIAHIYSVRMFPFPSPEFSWSGISFHVDLTMILCSWGRVVIISTHEFLSTWYFQNALPCSSCISRRTRKRQFVHVRGECLNFDVLYEKVSFFLIMTNMYSTAAQAGILYWTRIWAVCRDIQSREPTQQLVLRKPN
jgi:hypothetical protein